MHTFDLIVVGTGSAGKTVAEAVRQAGKTVAIIDKLPFGGTCSQRGCDPKKVLVGAAEVLARAAQLRGSGLTGEPTIDWPALMAFKRTFTDPVPANTEQKFAEQGIATFRGAARFGGPTTLHVQDNELSAKQIVLASGARPQPLGIPGEERLIDSTEFLELAELPRELVMVGGGYIAFEFAHIAARAGARVTILHRGERPLEGFDADVVALLVRAMEALGVRVLLNANVVEISGEPNRLAVHYVQHNRRAVVAANVVVHAAGRVPDVAELDLAAGNVVAGKRGVQVNAFLQSVSNPAAYACGDVSDKGLPLTPLAGYEARLVAQNLLHGNTQRFTDDPVPTTVFTVPPLASVGLTEQQAREQGKNVTVTFRETTDWYSARRIGEPVAGFKTLIDADTGYVVGAHLLGTGSEEVINLFALAMKHQIPARALGDVRYAYPTHASDLSYMLP